MLYELFLLTSLAIYDILSFQTPVGSIAICDIITFLFAFLYILVLLRSGSLMTSHFVKNSLKQYSLIFCFFIVSSIASALSSEYMMEALKGMYNYLVITTITLLLIYRLKNYKDVYFFLLLSTIISLCLSFISMLAAFQVITIPWSTNLLYSRSILGYSMGYSRSAGLFNNFSSFGMFLFYAIPFIIVKLFEHIHGYRTSARNICLICIYSCVLCILFAGSLMPQSRGLLISTIVLIGLTTLLYSFLYHGFIIRTVEVIFLVLFIFCLIKYWNVLSLVFYEMASESVDTRISQFQLALKSISFFGNGYNSFAQISLDGKNLHNGFLNILYSYGIFGMCIFIYLDIYCIKCLAKIYGSRNSNLSVMAIALAGTLAGCHFLAMSSSAIALNHFWIIFALIAALYNIFMSSASFIYCKVKNEYNLLLFVRG